MLQLHNKTMLIIQVCLIPCNLMDCSLPGSSVHGILQAKILEYWCVQSLSHVGLFVMVIDCSPPGYVVLGDSPGKNTRVGCHALLQGIFPTQGQNPGLPYCRWILYCLSHQKSRQPLLSPGDFPDQGIEPRSPALQAGFLPSEPTGKTSFKTVHLNRI